jgi:hypothetical protein
MRARGQALARAGGHPQLYSDWALSPLHGLLADTRGPVAYRWLPWSTTTSWLLMTALVGVLAVVSTRAAFALDRRPPP